MATDNMCLLQEGMSLKSEIYVLCLVFYIPRLKIWAFHQSGVLIIGYICSRK